MATPSKSLKMQAIEILKTLENAGYPTRMAGGCVRDRILRIEPKDYDIATAARPEEVQGLFPKTIPTGLDHGTITILTKWGPFEVTTLRRDVSTDGRHAEVSFENADFASDASRRDFTMNAMFEDSEGKLYDFHEGLKHLKERKLVFVGQPVERIREDYLRILRFFRFQNRYELTFDSDLIGIFKSLSQGLRQLSQERVTSELRQILAGPKVSKTLDHMKNAHVWPYVFPQIEAPSQAAYQYLDQAEGFLARLTLIAGQHEAAVVLGKHLKLSKQEQAILSFGAAGLPQTDDDASWMDLLDKCDQIAGTGTFATYFAPLWQNPIWGLSQEQLGEVQHTLSRLPLLDSIRLRPMPIGGRWLQVEMNLEPGNQLGACLNFLRRSFRNRDWQSAPEAKKLAKEFLGQKQKENINDRQ